MSLMRTRALGFVVIALAGIILGLAILFRSDSGTNEPGAKLTARLPIAEVHGNAPAKQQGSFTEQRLLGNASESEYNHLRVKLPPPIDAPWEVGMFDSQTALGEWKDRALELLPRWIRKAVLAGNSDLAGRYLATLIKLADSPDIDTSSEAVFALYALGDYNGIAAGHFKRWIQDDVASKRIQSNGFFAEIEDIRAFALRVIDVDRDRELLDVIYRKWAAAKTDGSKHDSKVDYAFFLETHGRTLPAEYWFQRLESRIDFGNTVAILEEKNPPGLLEQFQARFERGNSRSTDMLASSLFRMTGEPRYLEYLVSSAEDQLKEGIRGLSEHTLNGLAETNDARALSVLEKALQDPNSLVRKMAATALGRSTRSEATAMLYESAIKAAAAEKLVPTYQLKALLSQKTPEADVRYDQFKESAISGKLGFAAATSSFDDLDFYKRRSRLAKTGK